MNEHIPPRFRDPDRGNRTLEILHETFIRSGSRFTLAEFSALLDAGVLGSPDPEMMLTHMHRFVVASLSASTLFNDILQYPLYGDLLFKIFGASHYFADVLVREPGLFRWLTASDALSAPVTAEYLRPEVERVFSAFQKPEKRLDALKRLHRRELLRIGAQDLLGSADLASTTLQLSVLADVLVDAVLGIVADRAMTEIPFCVVGLGKIGGRELNYSSDIDILFVYGDGNEQQGGGDTTAHEHFNRLAEKVVRALSQPSEEGYFYRVDVRLRPESGAGPLARSAAGYLTYYESRGELWERQMLIKARAVAGDRSFGDDFLRRLTPFVYPRTFLEHPATSVARIKARIEAAVAGEANIKLMAGGIRDIEFIVQTLQLVNGGKHQDVREQNTLHALDRLRDNDFLSVAEHGELSSAYVLYRTVEHRLQTMLNTQTHTLPDDDVAYGALAKRMGLSSGRELRISLARHLASVRGIFRQVLSGTTEGSMTEGSTTDITTLVEGGVDEESMMHVLASHGFRDVRRAARHVKFLTAGSTLAGAQDLDRRTRDGFRAVAPLLFADLARTPDPDLTLASLTTLAGGQKVLHAFYAQMADQRFRRFVLEICAVSPRFARGLSQRPLVLETLASDPEALAGDPGLSYAGDLMESKLQRELAAGVRHVLGFTDFDQLTGELSAIASQVVGALLAPPGRRRSRMPLAVFALGKFGTAELGFDADLDLLFFAGETGPSGAEAAEKTAAALLNRLSGVTANGRLYDVDARLRPEGKNAPLVADAGAYARYLASRASLWERQSLTRLRFIAGDPTVGSYVTSLVASTVYDEPLPAGWSNEIVLMRRKMEPRSRTRGGVVLDFKRGAGGMADVEFITQMIQLKYGASHPHLRGVAPQRLLRSAGTPLLDGEERDVMASAYAMYRRIELLMRIGLEERGSVLPSDDKRDLLARLYDGSPGVALEGRLATTMKRVRSVFLAIAGRLA